MVDPQEYDMANVHIKEPVRDELRRYKAEHGMTYSEAIRKLLENSGWSVDE